MNMNEAQAKLKLVRLCMGKERKIYTSHRNEVLNADYAALNKNIQINIAKLGDAISIAENPTSSDKEESEEVASTN